ncbi:MAG: tetraacyldisaccharide 4'-kinase, partial [Thermoanaerobaculum sp.]|nr:tetraacyldisaccharide 4'-kinase [Thermoanaerobaculum sp.]MDW7968408.1 tetraacyldisaccharide 4'-kinase [Thermoanaerobaculum sp.]
RRRGAHCAVRLGATHAILDDGFQHWPLARELDLVVVDAKDPLGLRTLRREPPAALRWASRLVCVGEPEEQDGARRLLAPYHPLPPFPVRLVPLGWIWQGQVHPLQLLRQRRFVAFAGIARPGRFFHTLQGLGAHLVHRRGFADHHPYTPRQLATLLQLAHRLDAMLITTAKDHVRVPEPFAHQVAYLEVALVPLEESFATLLGPFGLVG